MKRLLLIALCLATLLSSGGQTETASSLPDGFYETDGYIQHTDIVAVLNTDGLCAPVEEISYSLFDNSDLGVSVLHYTMRNDRRTHRLELRQNGTWQEAPTCGVAMHQRLEAPGKDPDPKAHRTHKSMMDFRYIDGGLVHYLPLQAGEYRLILTYSLNTDDPDVRIPEGTHAAILYFTVT